MAPAPTAAAPVSTAAAPASTIAAETRPPTGGPAASPAGSTVFVPAAGTTGAAGQAATQAPAPSAAAPVTAGTPAAASAPVDPAGSAPSLVPLREFTRVSTTQPDYPDDARRAGTEGWVRLEFTVNERGQVRDIVVVAAQPRGVFEDAATAALSRWRFSPPVAADGQPVPLRTSVQLRFRLQD
jgi:protein TonB